MGDTYGGHVDSGVEVTVVLVLHLLVLSLLGGLISDDGGVVHGCERGRGFQSKPPEGGGQPNESKTTTPMLSLSTLVPPCALHVHRRRRAYERWTYEART